MTYAVDKWLIWSPYITSNLRWKFLFWPLLYKIVNFFSKYSFTAFNIVFLAGDLCLTLHWLLLFEEKVHQKWKKEVLLYMCSSSELEEICVEMYYVCGLFWCWKIWSGPHCMSVCSVIASVPGRLLIQRDAQIWSRHRPQAAVFEDARGVCCNAFWISFQALPAQSYAFIHSSRRAQLTLVLLI